MIFGASASVPVLAAAYRAFEPLWFYAATSDPAGSILDFAKYGILGLVLLAIVGGWLWAKPSVDQLKADKGLAEARADKMQETVELAVPALAEAAKAFKDVAPLVESARDQGRRVEEVLRQVQIQLAVKGPGGAA